MAIKRENRLIFYSLLLLVSFFFIVQYVLLKLHLSGHYMYAVSNLFVELLPWSSREQTKRFIALATKCLCSTALLEYGILSNTSKFIIGSGISVNEDEREFLRSNLFRFNDFVYAAMHRKWIILHENKTELPANACLHEDDELLKWWSHGLFLIIKSFLHHQYIAFLLTYDFFFH